ncbi:histone acetyltransferase NGG1 LALA0_S03e03400g [Lachancea lanzarotensis]|uniref:LALA0S03e03400g1_1 n=1 Tax=Lachancea lanzarotensis TaxID=1245769 RepID=A0A0C7MNM2_9SACH|nr:uncharacterized protein LALA0_S03e03400g [Lachancea lanzarotensis]CEP61462.1 LALA0S03e03400g1_1 [Lachancea lanzarotensis]
MSRPPRRGKGIKEENQDDELAHEPSRLLTSVLKTLDLTFERDIGMLNGKNVRSLPGFQSLQNLRGHLDKLETTLERISVSDKATITTIREILENTIAVEPSPKPAGEEENHQKLDILDTQEGEPETHASDDDADAKPVIQASRKRSLKVEDEEDEAFEHNNKRPANKALEPSPDVEKKIQSELDRIESDPSVKNPKSEFVVSQTLPAAAVSLGLFTNKGLESTGEEFLKKKYGVSSYPASDLKDLLPGEIPDMDFSRPKPANQIQLTTFLASVDSFYREFSDDDIKLLKNKYLIPPNVKVERSYDPEVTPYIIPKLGPLYADVWSKEDNSQNIANLSPPPLHDPTSILPKKSSRELSDQTLDTEEISCGPLVSRLLSAILRDDTKDTNSTEPTTDVDVKMDTPTAGNPTLTPSSEMDEDRSTKLSSTSNIPQQAGWKVNSVNLDYPTFEERLKRELKYVGIYMNLPKSEDSGYSEDPDWLSGREDDEISSELRELQDELRQVTKVNIKRKATLVPLVERRLAWQEYASILDDLDKQTDQAYVKRIRAPKNKKKKQQAVTSGIGSTSQAAIQAAHQQAANSSLKSLLDKRRRWVTKIGPLFDSPEIMKRFPKESVFRDMDQEEEDEEGDVFGSNGNNKDDELTDSLQNKDE